MNQRINRGTIKLIGLICILFFCIFLSTPINSYSETYPTLSFKDEAVAGFLSFVVPGLGHLYIDKPIVAASFFFSSNIALISSVLNVFDFHFYFKKDFGAEMYFRLKENISNARIIGSVGLGSLYIGLRIIDVILAIRKAKEYNANIMRVRFSNQIKMTPYLDNQGNFGGVIHFRF